MYRLKQLTLLVADFCCLYAALYISTVLRYKSFSTTEFFKLASPLTSLYLAAVIIMFIVGLYDVTQAKNRILFYKRIIISSAIWFTIGIFYFYLSPSVSVAPKTILALTTVTGFGLIALWRYIYNRFLSSMIWKSTVLFVGQTTETEALIKRLNQEPERGYQVIGIVEPTTTITSLHNTPVAKSISQLLTTIHSTDIQLIVIAPHLAHHQDVLKEIYSHLFEQIQVVELAHFYEQILSRIPPFTFSESWFLTNLHEQQKKMYDRFRIILDYTAALMLGIFFLITLPIVAPLIKLTSPGPIFFKQKRVGRQEKLFLLYKYRTMKVLGSNGSAEIHGAVFATKDDPRITSIGKFLRRTRIDELPQFINILKHEMGIIGPRPERPEFVQQLSTAMPFYSLRHLIKPGLTGWAQLQNSYYGTIEENLQKLEYDLYYIKNRGPLLDIAICLRTISVVLKMMGR